MGNPVSRRHNGHATFLDRDLRVIRTCVELPSPRELSLVENQEGQHGRKADNSTRNGDHPRFPVGRWLPQVFHGAGIDGEVDENVSRRKAQESNHVRERSTERSEGDHRGLHGGRHVLLFIGERNRTGCSMANRSTNWCVVSHVWFAVIGFVAFVVIAIVAAALRDKALLLWTLLGAGVVTLYFFVLLVVCATCIKKQRNSSVQPAPAPVAVLRAPPQPRQSQQIVFLDV